MRHTSLTNLVCVVFLMVTGCATHEPDFIPLAQDSSQHIGSSNAVILATQKEITADIDRSNIAAATGGGLIPALIDVGVQHSRAKTAEENIRPIRDVLVGFDMGEDLQQALGARLEAVPWLHVRKTTIIHESKSDQMLSLLQGSTEDALVVITPSYSLTSNFAALKIQSEVKVLPRAAHLKPAGEAKENDKAKTLPLYKAKVDYLAPLTTDASEIEVAAKEWAKDDGAAIKHAVQLGVASIAEKIIDVLTHPTTGDVAQ